MAELIAPIVEDLRQSDNRMDIIKGIENVLPKDLVMTAGVKSADIEAGDWLVNGSSGAALPGASSVPNTYPVWVGNDQFDSQATGTVTVLIGGHFIYRTNKFVSGSYSAGGELTVTTSNTTPSAASSGDWVLATVFTAPDANGIMEIRVYDTPYKK